MTLRRPCNPISDHDLTENMVSVLVSEPRYMATGTIIRLVSGSTRDALIRRRLVERVPNASYYHVRLTDLGQDVRDQLVDMAVADAIERRKYRKESEGT